MAKASIVAARQAQAMEETAEQAKRNAAMLADILERLERLEQLIKEREPQAQAKPAARQK